MTIWIDADACPVKEEAERVATRHGMRMVLVSNGGIRPSRNPLVESVYVTAGPDEADKHIASQCQPGDVVVTGDIPLAAKCVAAGARVIKANGDVLTEANIGLARGKKQHDKRESEKEREWQRERQRIMKVHNR